MKICYSASTLLVLAAFAVPQAAPAQEREARDLEGFDSVEVGGGIDLELRLAPEFFVEVASRGNLAEIMPTRTIGPMSTTLNSHQQQRSATRAATDPVQLCTLLQQPQRSPHLSILITA